MRIKILLIACGIAFASVLKGQLPESTLGALGFTLVLWAGFYPFMTTTAIPIGRYWVMLAVSLPIVLVFTGVAERIPFRAELSLGVLAIAITAWIAQRLRARQGISTRL